MHKRVERKGKQRIVCFVLILSLILSTPSAVFAGYDDSGSKSTYQNWESQSTGLYLGGGLGSVLPVGDGTEGVIAGGGWAIQIGYQFIKNLEVELGYNQGVGSISNNGVTGIWNFVELLCFDIKPIIPLSSAGDLYLLVGITYAENSVAWKRPNITNTLGPALGADSGIGYEYYMTHNWSLGGEIIYHHLTSTKESISPGGSITLHSPKDGSATSLKFMALYHF